MKKFLLLVLSTALFLAGKAQPPDKMQWFRDAKLGIFIHWGIYN
jgi:alpha-L-fucosidase